jgi:thiol-disulfide isomerase/thioredoxin
MRAKLTMRAVVATLAALSLVACGRQARQTSSGAEHAKLDFTLQDMNGTPVKLASFRGRPLLINVWATYCEPCKLEIPDLIELQEKYKATGFTVLGISFDDTAKDLREFAAAYKMTYPVLLGTDDMRDAYETIGIPTSWFIRKDGTISHTRVGIGTRELLEEQIRALF